MASWLRARATELETQAELKALGCAPVTHCPTGLARLDDAGLLELGVCTVVLGHEGDGKSALGLHFVEGAARAGFGVQAYWPEDPRRFVADRLFARATGESAAKLRRLNVDKLGDRVQVAAADAEEWASRVIVDDRRHDSRTLMSEVRRRSTKDTRLVLVDYAQVLGAETGESAERVITRFVWDLNEYAKESGVAAVLLSQVRTEVKERGRRLFDSWKFRNPNKSPTEEAVEGYRPLAGDGQWAPSALGQKARAVLSWFRPRAWLRMHGADVADDVADLTILKSNYGPATETARLGWDGPTTRVFDPKERK